MHQIVKVYKQAITATRFIGIKYGDKDRINGGFSLKWREWFKTERFNKLEVLITDDFKHTYEDYSAYIGLICWKEEEEKLQYWIGMFLPEGTMVPTGYEYIDFSASNLGVCWIYGLEPELYCKEEKCAEKLSQEGYEIVTWETGGQWFFERYVGSRFSKPDENGKVILDICHFIK